MNINKDKTYLHFLAIETTAKPLIWSETPSGMASCYSLLKMLILSVNEKLALRN